MKSDRPSPDKTNTINIISLLLTLASLFFCSCGLLVAFSFPLRHVNVTTIDTTIFTPELSLMTGLCLWIPALVTAVAAIGIWIAFGRTPLQRQLTQAQSELDDLRAMTLQTYLDQIGELVVGKKLGHTNSDPNAVQFARRRTEETLAVLDRQRQYQLLQFLHEAQLIGDQGALHIAQDDLPKATS